MTDIAKLKEEELEQLKPSVEVEEVGLEDLIVLGESKKVPIRITYSNDDGTKTRAKALIRQLTLKEMNNLQYNQKRLGNFYAAILKKALFKSDGTPFTMAELEYLPVGVVKEISRQIMDISGMDADKQDELKDF